MAYEARTWEDNELVTKDKLNHIEEGIANTGYYKTDSNGRSFNIDFTKMKVPQMSASVTQDSLTNTPGTGTVYFKDSDGNVIGYIRQTVTSTKSEVAMHAAIQKDNGTALFQAHFGVAIDRSTGEVSYSMTAPGALWNALIDGLQSSNIAALKNKLGIS